MSDTQTLPRRRGQFAIRTLLALITGAAICFGLLPWPITVVVLGSAPACILSVWAIRRPAKCGPRAAIGLIVAWLTLYVVSSGPSMMVYEAICPDPDNRDYFHMSDLIFLAYVPLLTTDPYGWSAVGQLRGTYLGYWQHLGWKWRWT